MQTLFCSNCGQSNQASDKRCTKCYHELVLPPNSELQLLKQELANLKTFYDKRFANLLHRIQEVEQQTQNEEAAVKTRPVVEKTVEKEIEEVAAPVIEAVTTPPIITPEPIEVVEEASITPIVENEPVQETIAAFTNTESISTESATSEEVVQEEIIPSTPVISPSEPIVEEPFIPREKSKAELAINNVTNQISSFSVAEFFADIFGAPLQDLWGFAEKLYTRYKEKNQLPVFFMTLAGVAALLFGFGYLMQVSASHLGQWGDLAKILVGFACSSGIAWWATALSRKAERYSDFSSALLGLSISLNYVFVYFLTNTDDLPISWLSSSFAGFTLIVANTVWAVYLSLKFETKIVAVLSLLGGAFAPFYLNSDGSSVVYFAYLWLLTASSVYVAYRIQWKTLAIIGLLTASSIIEMSLFSADSTVNLFSFTIVFHAFAYLFIWIGIYDGKKILKTLNKASIALIAGNLSVFLFNLFHLYSQHEAYTTLGIIYLANAFVFFPLIWFTDRKLGKQMRLLLLVISGTFIAVALPALFDMALLGLLWSIEALALLFLGYTFSMPSVRKEGYLLLGVAIAKTVYTFDGLWFISHKGILYNNAFFMLLSLGFVLASVAFLLKKYKDQNLDYENKLYKYTLESLSFWFIVSYFCVASFYTTQWLAFATIPATLLVIGVGIRTQLKVSRIFGYILFATVTFVAFTGSSILLIDHLGRSISNFKYVNLLGVGAFLLLLQGVIYKLKTDPKQRTTSIHTISLLLSLWFVTSLSITVLTYVPHYLSFFYIVTAVAYLYWGKLQHKQIQTIGYLLYAVSLVYSGYVAVTYIVPTYVSHSNFLSAGYINLLAIGVFLFALRWADKKFNEATPLTPIVTESFSVWFTVVYAVTAYYFIDQFAGVVAVLPLFGLVYIGNRKKLPFTEALGLGYAALLIIGITLSVLQVNSVRFLPQTLPAKIMLVELLCIAWGLKLFYQSIGSSSKTVKNADWVHELFFWLLPLLFLSSMRRMFPDYLGAFAWVALSISYVLREFTQRKTLLIEFYLLAAVAVALSYYSPNPLATIGASIAVIATILLHKKAYLRAHCFSSPYQPFFVAVPYYFGAALFIGMQLLYSSVVALSVAGSYFALITMFRKFIVPLRTSYLTAFWIGVALTVSGLFNSIKIDPSHTSPIVLLPVLFLGALLYSKFTVYARQKATVWIALLLGFQVIVFGTYALLLHGSLLTIAIIVHAILVLFNSMKEHCKPMVWQSVLLFIAAVGKLYFRDIAHFSMNQKVIVFVVIGALLIGSSFLYVKLKERIDKNKPNN